MAEQAATAAPATPVAVEAPSGPGDSLSPVQTTIYSDDDQIIDQMAKEVREGTLKPGGSKKAEEPTPAKDGGTKKAPSKPKDAPAPASGSGGTLPTYDTPEAAVEAILGAFESGDTKALAKATGKPEAFFKVTDAKWAAFREQQSELKTGMRALNEGKTKLDEGVRLAREEFGPAIRAAKAYKDGDMTKFVELVSELAGEDYDEAQRKVIEGELAADPQTKAMRRRLNELEAKEKAREQALKNQEQTKAQRDEQARASVNARITNETKGHPVSKVRGFQDLILDKIRDSWSEADNAHTMGIAEAADAVVEDRRLEAEELGLTRREAPAPEPTYSPKAPSRAHASSAKPGTRPAWETEDLDDDDIIASLEADRKAGRIK